MASNEEISVNTMGIPSAEFVEDVAEFMERPGNDNDVSAVLRNLDEKHNKYRFMELNLVQRKQKLKKKIPDMKESLDVINLLKKRRELNQSIETNFLLSDQVYMRAKVKPLDTIYLWLGANVMLEHTIEEAEDIITKSLQIATNNLVQIEQNLGFLRDQITTTEVNMARVINWDIKRRQSEKVSS